MRQKFQLASLAAILVTCAPAMADDSADRFYFGAGGADDFTDTRAHSRTGFSPASGLLLLPIDELYFKDQGPGWRAFAGWTSAAGWGIELASEHFARVRSDPVLILPSNGSPALSARLRARSWTLSTSYSRSVGGNWYAAIRAGIARSTFDVTSTTSAPVFVAVTPTPVPTVPGPGIGVPVARLPQGFVTPENRTGWSWGVAAGWKFSPRWCAELGYRKFDLKIIKVETLGIDARWSF